MQSTVPSGVVADLLKQQYEPGTVIRIVRTTAGWSQAELGRRCGYSASTVSRWETGRLPLRDVKLLRTLANMLALPPEVFGLLPGDTTGAPTRSIRPSSHKVARFSMPRCKEDERVRRRRFLLAAGLAGPSLAWSTSATALAGEVDPAVLLARQLGGVLLGPDTSAEPVAAPVLREVLTVAQRGFLCLPVHRAGRPPAGADRRRRSHCHQPSGPCSASDTRRVLQPVHSRADQAGGLRPGMAVRRPGPERRPRGR